MEFIRNCKPHSIKNGNGWKQGPMDIVNTCNEEHTHNRNKAQTIKQLIELDALLLVGAAQADQGKCVKPNPMSAHGIAHSAQLLNKCPTVAYTSVHLHPNAAILWLCSCVVMCNC